MRPLLAAPALSLLLLAAPPARAEVKVVGFTITKAPLSSLFLQRKDEAHVLSAGSLLDNTVYLVAPGDTDTHYFSRAVVWKGSPGRDAARDASPVSYKTAEDAREQLKRLDEDPQGYLDSPEAPSTKDMPEGNRDRVINARRRYLQGLIKSFEEHARKPAKHHIALRLTDDNEKEVRLEAEVPDGYPFSALGSLDAAACRRLGEDVLSGAPEALNPARHKLAIDLQSGQLAVVDQKGKTVALLLKSPGSRKAVLDTQESREKFDRSLNIELPR